MIISTEENELFIENLDGIIILSDNVDITKHVTGLIMKKD